MRITSCTLSWSTWSIVKTDKNGASGNSFLYFHRKTSWQPKSACPMMMEMKIFSSLRMVDYTRRLHGAEGRAKQFLLNGNQENVISLAVQLLCHTSSQLYSPLPAQSIIRFSMRFDSNVFPTSEKITRFVYAVKAKSNFQLTNEFLGQLGTTEEKSRNI